MTFPQHPRKHRFEPLFTATEFQRYVAKRTGAPPPRAPRSVVLCYGRRWKRYLTRGFQGGYDRDLGLYRASPHVGVAMVAGPGAPFAAMIVEELAALGVRRFVVVGMAGSLQPDLRAGSLVLCDKALRDEGTSHHYEGPGRFAHPSASLTAALRAELSRSGTPFQEGPSWTTDSVYRETVPEVRRYRRQGILTVEMEASAVFAVARAIGCGAAALFVISDNLDERGWEPRFHDCRPRLRRALRLGVAALEN